MSDENPLISRLDDILKSPGAAGREEKSLFEMLKPRAEDPALPPFPPTPQTSAAPAAPPEPQTAAAPPSPQIPPPAPAAPAEESVAASGASQELRAQVRRLEAKLSAAQEKALEATLRLQEREAARKEMEEMFKSMRAEQRLEEARQAERELGAKMQGRIEALEGRLDKQFAELQAVWQGLFKEIRSGQLEETKKSLEEQKRSSEDQKKSLEDQRASLEDQKGSLEDQKNSLEDQRKSLEDQKRLLEDQKKSLEEQRIMGESEFGKVREELAGLRRLLEERGAEQKRLSERLEREESVGEDREQGLREVIADKAGRSEALFSKGIESLRSELEAFRKEMGGLAAGHSREMEDSRRAFVEKLHVLEQQLIRVETAADARFQHLEPRMQTAESADRRAVEQQKDLSDRIVRLEAHWAHFSQDAQSLTGATRQISQGMESVLSQLRSQEARLKDFEAEGKLLAAGRKTSREWEEDVGGRLEALGCDLKALTERLGAAEAGRASVEEEAQLQEKRRREESEQGMRRVEAVEGSVRELAHDLTEMDRLVGSMKMEIGRLGGALQEEEWRPPMDTLAGRLEKLEQQVDLLKQVLHFTRR